MRRCPDCGEEKPPDDFYRRRSRPQGRQHFCKECSKARSRANHNPERKRVQHLRRTYGISLVQEQEMRERQGGACGICRTAPATHVDHHHETGAVRGLLCNPCNVAIGLLREDIATMENAIVWLKPKGGR